MNFDLSDEQKMLLEGARRYVSENLGLTARRTAATSKTGFSARDWTDFADMGWLALPLPEEVGGLAGGDVEIALLMEELGRGLATAPFVDTVVLAATVIAASEMPELRQQLLGRIATGDCIVSLAHVETEGRSEYQTPVGALAARSAAGWTIRGIKSRVFHGAAATHWLVSARINGGDDFGLFVVDRAASAVAADEYELVDGTRCVDLRFRDTPAQMLVGDGPCAATVLELALDRTIVALAAATVGSMEAVMSLTADYLKQRSQYGQTLSKFQSLQHRMAEMFVETDQARSMVTQGLAALESGDPVRRARAASGTKALVTQAAYFVTGQGIQLHGGIGVTEEYAVGHHFKSTLTYDKRFGDREFHLARSAGLAQGPGT